MRSPIGLKVLLVLLVGLFVCLFVGSISGFEESEGDDVKIITSSNGTIRSSESLPAGEEIASVESESNNEENSGSEESEKEPRELYNDSTSEPSIKEVAEAPHETEKRQQGSSSFGMPSSGARELSSVGQTGQPQQPQVGQAPSSSSSSSSSSVSSSSSHQAPSVEPQLSPPANLPLGVNDENQRAAGGADQQQPAAPVTARGLFGQASGPSGQQPPEAGQALFSGPVAMEKPENLPTIIEKDQPVSLQQQQIQHQRQQHQQQQSVAQNQQQPQQSQSPASAAPQQQQQLTLPPATMIAPAGQDGVNGTAGSGARTFTDGWTNCMGASSNKYGYCKNDMECKKNKGSSDGSCMGGLGVCCVMALSCGDKSQENNTFFANQDFPEPSWEARLCEVEVKKKHMKISQIMIEFEEFDLAPPNHDGECITDVFQIKLASNKVSPYSLLRICGQNTGQHMYLDVSQIEDPLVLSVATSGGGFPRRWSIRIVQIDDKNQLLAPPGCLQYYTDTIGHFRSFNLGRNLRNLYYAICFRIDNGYSGIRFTSNFFGMNGPQCRTRKLPMGIGRHNATMPHVEAHPHHLVIPPPGYAPPMPRPSYPPANYQTSPKPGPYGHPVIRQRRFAYFESGDRVQRTFGSDPKDFKEEKKWMKSEPERELYPPPSYGSGYESQAQGYGPPPPYHHGSGPAPHYPPGDMYHRPSHYYGSGGYAPEHEKDYMKHDKEFAKHEKMDDKMWMKQDKKDGGWWWMKQDKKEDKFEKSDKYGWKSDREEAYGGYYGPPSYPGGYSHYGPPAYGPPHHGGYGPGYGHGYGHGYNDYHHKEIDKFGKKYEHLEYKQEKNHLDKEAKKDEKSWWFWGKKDDKKGDKKGDKFFQHHEALFPMMHIPEMPHCEPRYCGQNDVITFPPSGDSISEMCGNRFNRGRGPKIISGSPLVVYVSNRGMHRGAGFDMNYEQVFYIPRPY